MAQRPQNLQSIPSPPFWACGEEFTILILNDTLFHITHTYMDCPWTQRDKSIFIEQHARHSFNRSTSKEIVISPSQSYTSTSLPKERSVWIDDRYCDVSVQWISSKEYIFSRIIKYVDGFYFNDAGKAILKRKAKRAFKMGQTFRTHCEYGYVMTTHCWTQGRSLERGCPIIPRKVKWKSKDNSISGVISPKLPSENYAVNEPICFGVHIKNVDSSAADFYKEEISPLVLEALRFRTDAVLHLGNENELNDIEITCAVFFRTQKNVDDWLEQGYIAEPFG